MPAALMTLSHFLVSEAMHFAASAGVLATMPMPGFLDSSAASLDDSTRRRVALSFSIPQIVCR